MKRLLFAVVAPAILLAGCAEAAPEASPQGGSPSASTPQSSAAAPSVSVSATVVATPSTPATPSAAASGAAAIPADLQAIFSPDVEGGGPHNVVRVVNQNDGKVRSDGRLQGKTMHNGNVQPVNQAYALASCTNCQTYAVAMQIVVYPKSATTVAPVNEAIALNYHCTGCNTVARALQYAIPTDDPDKLPPSVQNLSRQIAREVGSIQQTPAITPAEADARVNAVIVQFGDLAQNLSDKRSETHDQDSPNASPLPSTSAAPSGAASPSATTVDLSATATPTPTVTPDQAASQGQNAAATPAPSNSTG